MSGVLILNATDSWMPSVGAYDAILEGIVGELRSADAELAELVESALSHRSIPWLDLSALVPPRLRTFLDATSSYLDRILAEPGIPFGKIRLTSQLEAVLRIEPRVAQPEPDGELAVPSGAAWRASGWIYDLVLAHVAGTIKDVATPDASAWADRTQRARVRLGGARCDLHELPASLLPAYADAVSLVTRRLGGGVGLDTVVPRFNEALVEPLAQLADASAERGG
jgi:hypothetical protein